MLSSESVGMSKALGRPRKTLDPEVIARFIGKGFTVEYVARLMDVCVDTLYGNYSDALKKGYAFREGCLQAKQFKDAMKGNATLLIWLGKQWLNQTDKSESKITHEHTDLGHLSDEQLEQVRRIVDGPGHLG